jgi:phosphoglycolate phosphatase
VGITRSVQYALAKFGIAERAENLKHFIGPPLHHSFMAGYAFDEPAARQAVEHYREYFGATGIYENVLFPGMPALLGELKADGRSLSVVTSKPTFYAEQIVRHFSLDGFFDAVIGAEMDLSNSEKPLLVGLAIERYASPEPSKVVMIGDREHDVLAAHANGIDSIAVTYGAGSRDELVAARPSRIVDSIEELGSALGL